MKKTRAFTLVELLLALAITSILVVLLVSVVSATLGAWQQGRNRIGTFSIARQHLSRIGDEIIGAVAATGRVEFVENDARLAGGTPADPEKSENVFFVAPYPNSGAGDLCVIAYRHNATAYTLERAFKDSAAAWAAGSVNRFKILGYNGALEWRKVADGVVEFELRSYSQSDLDTNTTPLPSWNSASSGTMAGKTPRRVVLRLKTVDDKTLARLAALSPGSPAYTQVLLQSARDFTADVNLPAR